MSKAPEAAIPRSCQNCGAALTGRYCGFCGQRALKLDVSLRELLREGLHEFVHLDKRILVTLRLLFFQPGRLTADMLVGRRARYIPPLRLYVVASLLFFLTLGSVWRMDNLKISATDTDTAAQQQPDSRLNERMRQGVKRAVSDKKAFIATVWSRAPKAAILMVPAFALLTMLLFRRRVRFFVPHLYFALHYHCFVFLLAVLLAWLGRWVSGWFVLGVVLIPPVYLVTAARTSFETGWLEAILKSVLVLGGYLLLLFAAVMGVFLLTLLWF